MPHVRFIKNFDYHVPGSTSTIAYKAGWSGLVTTPCANLAIGAGKAKAIRRNIETTDDSTGSSGPASL